MKKLLIFLFAIFSLTLQAQTVYEDNTYTATVTAPNGSPTAFTFRRNSLTTSDAAGYLLDAGDESVDDGNNNNLDNMTVTGNRFVWNGSYIASIITHGVFTGCNINANVVYNFCDRVPMSIIKKSASPMTDLTGGVAYNIIREPGAVGITVKGISGVKIYNNTLYSEQPEYTAPGSPGTWRGLVDVYENTDDAVNIFPEGTKVKNNIFYTKYQIYNIRILEAEDLVGFESDYNIFYCEAGTPLFEYLGDSKTFAQWQALGFDTHSQVIDPDFNNTTALLPSARLDYGTDLGSNFQTGLSTSASWTVGVQPETTNQNGAWQVGARVYAGTGGGEGGTTYYLAPNGSDNNPGTITQPFFTLNKAWTVVTAGDLILMRGGTYSYTSTQDLYGKSGTYGNEIGVWAYPYETPVIERGGGFSFSGAFKSLVHFSGNYVHWKGIAITGNTQTDGDYIYPGMFIYTSNNCTFELLNVHHNGMGVWLNDNISGQNSDNNIFLNCDIHHNEDPLTTGAPYGNGDGLGVNIKDGNTLSIRGCRFWYNSDDGIDPYGSDAVIIIDKCWAFYNGLEMDTFNWQSDANGIKYGGTTTDHGSEILYYTTNCISYRNGWIGYNTNGAEAAVAAYNNISALNGTDGSRPASRGFQFKDPDDGRVHILKNNISYNDENANAITAQSTVDHNTFLVSGGDNSAYTLTSGDFASVDASSLTNARQANGDLPIITFLHLVTGSDLKYTGTHIASNPNDGDGKAWNNPPSLGAFEYGTVSGPVLVTSLLINTTPVASVHTVSTYHGTLQFTVTSVTPSNAANQTVTWSVTNQTGSGTINSSGLFTASTNGTVVVYATANDGSGVWDDFTITISNQVSSGYPTVTTTAISQLTGTSAVSGGNVTSDGGAAVSAKGICYSTSANPTTASTVISGGTGVGSFASSITGLTKNTTYHVRAFATNTNGTTYGADIAFTTRSYMIVVF